MAIYAPLVHAYGIRHGMQDADAADVAQKVLQSVAQSIASFEYDRSKGSFRGWLFTLTRNEVFKALRQQQRLPTPTGETAYCDSASLSACDEQDESAWNRDHERQLFDWAAAKARVDFREATWRAFWAVAVEGKPASSVARELDLSTGAVYIAKSRVTARIRQLIESAEII